MNHGLIVYPLLVQMGLSLGLVLWLGLARVRAVRRREVGVSDMALSDTVWPPRIRQIGNNYRNQFELPVLFYVLGILLYVTWAVTWTQLVLAWAFVASRLVHSYIHVTSNHVVYRFYAFATGAFLLGMMVGLYALNRLGVL